VRLATILTIVVVAVLCVGLDATSAAPFQNLDFESAYVGNTSPGNTIATSQALPYWTANSGGTALDYIGYDTMALDGSGVFLEDGLGNLQIDPLQGN
jgi:hypothetical protein